MARAAEQGFRVSKPWGESARYDFALEANGRFLRIQVKSTVSRSRNGYRCVIQPDKTRSERYTSEQVDFFAAYIVPMDVWYILPAENVVGMSSQIHLSPHRKEHRYARYKEAWHLLHEAVAKKDIGGLPELDISEGNAQVPEPVADPNAEPAEIPLLRGAVESAPAVGFDADLVRKRFMGCFERMLKRR